MEKVFIGKIHYVADALTVSRVFFSILIFHGALRNSELWEITLLVAFGLLSDAFDGYLARKYGGTYLGWMDFPADILFVLSILTYLIKINFIPPGLSLAVSVSLILFTVLFKNDAPISLWMGAVYGSFILHVYLKNIHLFLLLLLSIITIIGVNPTRAKNKVLAFLRDTVRLFKGQKSDQEQK